MKTNRIQFQEGLSLNQFLADYGTEQLSAKQPLSNLDGPKVFSVQSAWSRTTAHTGVDA